MRHVELSLRPETREPVLDLLDAEAIDYTLVPAEDGKYVALVSFSLPRNAVEEILDNLQEAGLNEADHTVVVTADTVISREFRALKERYASTVLGDDRLARQELHAEAEDLISTVPIYVTMTLLSVIVATAGLLLDSSAVVVGSMVIAPLLGPALAASVGTVLNESELFLKGVRYQVYGVAAAIIGATAFAWLAKSTFLVPPGIDILEIDEVNERLLPNLLSLFIAFGAGIAGVLSLATGISTALVGVMIAAALIPPAAAAGIAIARGIPTAATGSIILVFVNLLGINVTGLFTLWMMGYRPPVGNEMGSTRRTVGRHVVIFVTLMLVLSTFLVGVTWASYERATLENEITTETEAVLESPGYQDVALLEVELYLEEDVPLEPRMLLGDGTGLQRPDRVVVTVEQPVGDSNPELASAVTERIDGQTWYDMTVRVRFVEYDGLNSFDWCSQTGTVIKYSPRTAASRGGFSIRSLSGHGISGPFDVSIFIIFRSGSGHLSN